MADWITEQSVAEYADLESMAESFAVCAERISIDLESSIINSRSDHWIVRAMLEEKQNKLKKAKGRQRTRRSRKR